MKRGILAALIAASMMAATSAQSQSYQVLGPGSLTCGTWTEYRNMAAAAPKVAIEAWVEGYVSAMNGIGSINGHGPGVAVSDSDGMFHWLDNYCGAHPLEHISSATVALLQALDQRDGPARAAP